MDEAGQRLRQARERLNLKIREVEEASRKIAEKHGREDYSVVASRLSEIENRGLIPSLHRLYSLCAIYRLDFEEVLGWYGISLSSMLADGQFVPMTRTHPVRSVPWKDGSVLYPITLEPGFDPGQTSYLTRVISRWGKVLDETRRKVATAGWNTELERPIYFLEHRTGYFCCWCVQDRDRITLMPHPASGCAPLVFALDEVDIVGQVVALAMRFDERRRRRPRSGED
jgi:transcriptional regulator with XRE-family HTH domain